MDTAVKKASFLSQQFASGLPYDRYLQTGTDEQQRRWTQVFDAARLTDTQKQLVAGFVRILISLAITEVGHQPRHRIA